MSAIRINNISKSYKNVCALNNITFDVAHGELFGLIGPDGAGKSTLFNILCTLLLPDSGTASVENLDVVKDFKIIRKDIGYMPGTFALYQDLTIEENINFFASIFNVPVDEGYKIIAPIYEQIAPFKHRRAGKLSGGMKQKLALCCALIHQPKVLFLDEPTTGVDVVSRQEFWNLLWQLKLRGITILVSTPYMDEALKCERIALINKGCLLEVDNPQILTERYGLPTIEDVFIKLMGEMIHTHFQKKFSLNRKIR